MLLLPIAYEQHPMVQHPGVTLWLPVHTSAVELERLVAGVNGDAARSLGCNGVHQLSLWTSTRMASLTKMTSAVPLTTLVSSSSRHSRPTAWRARLTPRCSPTLL